MPENLLSANQDTEDGCCCNWSYEEQPLVHDVSRQQVEAITVAAILHPLQPLGHPQLLPKDNESQQDEGSAVRSCPWSACCQSR